MSNQRWNFETTSPAREPEADDALFDIVSETERLLSGRKRALRLTGHMLELYRLDSWRQRSAIVRAWMVWVAIISVVVNIVYAVFLPDVSWQGAMLAGLIVIPAMNAAIYLLWLRPRTTTIEGLSIIVWMLTLFVALASIGVNSGDYNGERFATGALFVCAVGIVVLGIDLTATIVAALGAMLLFLFFHLINPTMPVAIAIAVTVFYSAGILATVIARRTLTIISQHSFLIALRDLHRREELAAANIQLAVLATTDALTGIANRRSAGEIVARLWKDENALDSGIAFVMADIDHFKLLNDTRGHAAGDACIRQVAQTIVDVIRPECDFASRHGGEEFLVVLTKVTADEAIAIAERIRQTIESLCIPNPQADGGIVTLSIGIGLARDDAGAELVTKWADDALYEAKRLGRNQISISVQQEANRDHAPERSRSVA